MTSYDYMSVRVPKGDKEKYKARAEERGKNLNQLIIELLEHDISIHSIKYEIKELE